jgi:hypothetical protein
VAAAAAPTGRSFMRPARVISVGFGPVFACQYSRNGLCRRPAANAVITSVTAVTPAGS